MNIDKEVLFRFFNQEATVEEQQKIKSWVEESDEHQREFFKERKLYNDIILNADINSAGENNKYHYSITWRKIAIAVSTVAALVVIAISSAVYFTKQTLRDEPMNVITVPQGQRTNLVLSDGTKVSLNANSRFEYPPSFKIHDTRNVKIDGEAYFEVSKDKSHPFIVETPYGKVQVLGTKFYVDSYSKSNKFETSLIEGVVKVTTPTEEAILHPNEKVELKSGRLVLEPIENNDTYRWREGLYCFRDVVLGSVFEQFEKYYDVKFVVKNKKLLSTHISGKFRLIDGLDFAMKVLQEGVNFKYYRDEESNIIYIK